MTRPLEGRYAPTVLTALLALTPYIVQTSASELYRGQVMAATGLGKDGFQLTAALATAAYAFGALLGGDLINRFPQRRLFLTCEAFAAVGWLLAATARSPLAYEAGEVLSGAMTGLLLVIALPPIMRQFPAERVPLTAALVNVALFGGVAAGPLLGGVVGVLHDWRGLHAALAAIAVLNLALAFVTLPDQKAADPGLPLDLPALLLGLGATVPPFWAAGALGARGFGSPLVLSGLAAGAICLIGLLLTEYHRKEPLAPVKPMWNTFPIVGVVVATFGGGVFLALTRLALEELSQARRAPPLQAGLEFWPQAVGALAAAALLGLVLRTRFLPVLVLGGMGVLSVAAALLAAPGVFESPPLLLADMGLLGLGAGATVSPGLFLGGLSLPSQLLGRIVALIELVRSVGDFIMAPVVLRLAQDQSRADALTVVGVRAAAHLTLGVAVATALVGAALWVAGGKLLQRPDLAAWLGQKGSALDSPPLLARLRR